MVLKTPPSPARLTTTIYSYAEQLLASTVPGCVWLLGLRWSFGRPRSGLDALTEYSLPLNPTEILDALEVRGGIRIERHVGDSKRSLHEHLASGQPAIVAIDAYYLPFRPAYHRIHSSRTVLVRKGGAAGETLIHDGWAPASEGVLCARDLDRARFSMVPMDPEREPLFAGKPVLGEWFNLDVTRLPLKTDAGWVVSMIDTLKREMMQSAMDDRGTYGLSALRDFLRWLDLALNDRSDSNSSLFRRRAASLVLRVELSSRLYFCAFLRAAAHWLRDPFLYYQAEDYRRSLGHFQAGLDVLIKTLRRRRLEYDEFIRSHLLRAYELEENMGNALSSYGRPHL